MVLLFVELLFRLFCLLLLVDDASDLTFGLDCDILTARKVDVRLSPLNEDTLASSTFFFD